MGPESGQINPSEKIQEDCIRYLMRGRTTFVIAHRLSTVRQADQILVLDAGQLVEHGNHDSLYARRGRYYDLYTKQQHQIARHLWRYGLRFRFSMIPDV